MDSNRAKRSASAKLPSKPLAKRAAAPAPRGTKKAPPTKGGQQPTKAETKAETAAPVDSVDRDDVAASCGDDLSDRSSLGDDDDTTQAEQQVAAEVPSPQKSKRPTASPVALRPGAPPHRKPLTKEDKLRLQRRSVEADEELRRTLWLSIYAGEFTRAVLPAARRHIGVLENFRRRLVFLESARVLLQLRSEFLAESEHLRRQRIAARYEASHLQMVGDLIHKTEARLRSTIAREQEDGSADLRSGLSLAELPVGVEAVDDVCSALLAETVALPPQAQITAAARNNSSHGTPLDAFFRAASRAGFVDSSTAHHNHSAAEAQPEPTSPYVNRRGTAASLSGSNTFNSSVHLRESSSVYHLPSPRIQRRAPRPPSGGGRQSGNQLSTPAATNHGAQGANANDGAAERPATVDDLLISDDHDVSDDDEAAQAPPPQPPAASAARRPFSARAPTSTRGKPEPSPRRRPQSARVQTKSALHGNDVSPARSQQGARALHKVDSTGHLLTAFSCTPILPAASAAPSPAEFRAISFMSGARSDTQRAAAYQQLLGTMGNTQANVVVGAVLSSMRPVQMREAKMPNWRRKLRKAQLQSRRRDVTEQQLHPIENATL